MGTSSSWRVQDWESKLMRNKFESSRKMQRRGCLLDSLGLVAKWENGEGSCFWGLILMRKPVEKVGYWKAKNPRSSDQWYINECCSCYVAAQEFLGRCGNWQGCGRKRFGCDRTAAFTRPFFRVLKSASFSTNINTHLLWRWPRGPFLVIVQILGVAISNEHWASFSSRKRPHFTMISNFNLAPQSDGKGWRLPHSSIPSLLGKCSHIFAIIVWHSCSLLNTMLLCGGGCKITSIPNQQRSSSQENIYHISKLQKNAKAK